MIAIVALLTLGADIDRARFEKIGHDLVCTCGCNQILVECNHVGCQVSEGMRKQIEAGLTKGDNNQAILAGFVDRFGPTVLAAPTMSGFNRVAWITPFAVFALATMVAVVFIRRWQMRRLPSAHVVAHAPAANAYIDQARKETEL